MYVCSLVLTTHYKDHIPDRKQGEKNNTKNESRSGFIYFFQKRVVVVVVVVVVICVLFPICVCVSGDEVGFCLNSGA